MEIVTQQKQSYIIKILRNSEFLQTLTDFCSKENIYAAYLTAIGACGELTLAWYNVEEKMYEEHVYKEDLEIAAIIGNASLVKDMVFIHAHGVFGRRDMSVIGGHVRKMVISAACEVRLEVLQGKIEREYDEFTGLNLMKCEV